MISQRVRSQLPEPAELDGLVREAFGVRASSVELLGEGAFAYVQLVHLPCEPGRVIVKWYKYPGCGQREWRQLEVLRRHACVKVPEPYFCEAGAGEALVMEYIPGIPASEVTPPSAEAGERLAEEIVDALVHWHSVKHQAGFGEFDGPFHRTWPDFYQKRLHLYFDELCYGDSAGVLSTYVMETAARSLASLDDILRDVCTEAALVHSDYWLPNILIDAEQYRLAGVIDPLDAEWADPEIDLIHLEWPWGDKDYLLKLYLQQVSLPDGFPLRSALYRFWYTMQNLARIGWHDEGCDREVADALNAAMDRYL